MINNDFYIAIATFTDERFIKDTNNFVAGEKLIKEFLNLHFDKNIVDKIIIEAFDPVYTNRIDKTLSRNLYKTILNKNKHIENIISKIDEEIKDNEIIFFDDSKKNIEYLLPSYNGVLVDRDFTEEFWNQTIEMFKNNVKNDMISLTINN